MDLTKLNPEILRELVKLSEQKVILHAQITAIDKKITALATGKAVADSAVARGQRSAAAPKTKEPKTKRTGKRGALKEQIIGLLSTAGPSGIGVRDIAAQLGVKNQNVHVWFSTTGKKLDDIQKVGEARYALIKKDPASAPAPVEPASTEPTVPLAF